MPPRSEREKVVIDANNHYPERDGRIAALDQRETTTSEFLANHLASAWLLKALSVILAADLESDGLPRRFG